jgi:ankyrin repeat protein
VSARDNYGGTALIYAANHGYEMVEALLTKGADVNAKANNGSTALMAAAQTGHIEIVEALLARGADVNAKALASPH